MWLIMRPLTCAPQHVLYLETNEQVKEEQIKKKKCCEFIDKLEEDDVFENISLVSPMVDYVYENKMLEKNM